MSVSLWQSGPAYADYRADVCVVGGGIAGLSCARTLEDAGASVTVVESRRVGAGASGRNAGYLMRGAASCYAAMTRELGRGTAREVWRWTEDNLKALRGLGVELTRGYGARGSCLVAIDDGEAADLEASHAMMGEDGFASELIEAGAGPDDSLWARGEARLGLLNPDDAVCDPVALVGLLRARLRRTRVLEGTPVVSIDEADDGVVVRTAAGTVACERVVVCVNAWAAEVLAGTPIAGVIEPNRGQMLAARFEGGRRLEWAYYINRGHDYLRSGPGGLVVFGGARDHAPDDEAGHGEAVTGAIQAVLERRLERYLGPGGRVERRWAGTMAFTPDGLPLVGAVPGRARVWVCAGFNGHGMSMAHTAGVLAAGMVGGEPGRAVFEPGRFGGVVA